MKLRAIPMSDLTKRRPLPARKYRTAAQAPESALFKVTRWQEYERNTGRKRVA